MCVTIKKKILGTLSYVLLVASMGLFFTLPAQADIVTELMERQARITSVQALFTQEKHTRLLAKPVRSEGRFLYRRPSSIRWEYSGSASMQVIFNGRDLWLYYPDLREADRLTGLAEYASLMHFDVATLSRDYEISAKREKGLVKLRLVPKRKGPVSLIEMEIPGDSAFPGTVRISDSNNEPTSIIFRDVRLNSEVKEDLFTFNPGKDVVVRERSLR